MKKQQATMDLQTGLVAGHSDIFPHDVSEFLVDGVDRNLALDSEESVDSCLNSLLSLFESRIICVCLRLCELG